MKNILSLLFGVILLAGPAYAQGPDASGTWDMNFNTPNGPIAAVLTLKREGEKLSGTIAGPQGEAALQGSQKDKAIAINFSVQTSNGPFAIAMSGTQEGDVISGTMDFGGQGQSDWTGKRRGGGGSCGGARRRQGRRRQRQRRRPRTSPPTFQGPGSCRSISAATPGPRR